MTEKQATNVVWFLILLIIVGVWWFWPSPNEEASDTSVACEMVAEAITYEDPSRAREKVDEAGVQAVIDGEEGLARDIAMFSVGIERGSFELLDEAAESIGVHCGWWDPGSITGGGQT